MKAKHQTKGRTIYITSADWEQLFSQLEPHPIRITFLEQPPEPLIRIDTNQQGESVVSARELHQFLEVKTRFNDWIKRRIEEYSFVRDTDFTVLKNEYGRESGSYQFASDDYALTLDMAKELSMVERTPKGKEARQYFIACEKALRQLTSAPTPAARTTDELTRIRIRNLVTSFARIQGQTEQYVWRFLYAQLLEEHSVKVWARERGDDENFLDVVAREGHLGKLYAIADRQLSPFL